MCSFILTPVTLKTVSLPLWEILDASTRGLFKPTKGQKRVIFFVKDRNKGAGFKVEAGKAQEK